MSSACHGRAIDMNCNANISKGAYDQVISAHGAMEGETHSRIEWEVEGRQPSRPGNAGHDPPRCTLPKLERA